MATAIDMREDDDIEDAVHIEGSSEALQKVSAFLQKKLADNLENEEATTIVLSQHWRNGHKQVVSTFEHTFDVDMKQLADEIVDAAVDDCDEGRFKSMRYHMECEPSETGRTIRGHVQFTLKCPQYDDEDEDDIEDPSKKGLLTQTMRHQEKGFQMATGAVENVLQMYKEENQALRERVQLLESKYIDNMKAFEDLISGKHARDLEMRRQENSEARKDMALSMVLQGAPILIGKFMGGPKAAAEMAQHVPGGRTQLELMIEGFLRTFDGDQLQKVAESGLLNPIQLGGFMEILKFCMERDEVERKVATQKDEVPKEPKQQEG